MHLLAGYGIVLRIVLISFNDKVCQYARGKCAAFKIDAKMIAVVFLGYVDLLAHRVCGKHVLAEVKYNSGTVLTADTTLYLSLPAFSVLKSFVISEGNLSLVQLYEVAVYRFEVTGGIADKEIFVVGM